MICKIVLKRVRKVTKVELLDVWQLQLFCTDFKKFYDVILKARDGMESALCLGNSVEAF